ncbi:hypothetical protein ABGB16_30645, partial [Micromonospora sp. B11E3]|uniref:hypothetical protein n=1 Tax=Micromonospora sp. B11E3 TaxID=3153562 RepID=UPI00325EE527
MAVEGGAGQAGQPARGRDAPDRGQRLLRLDQDGFGVGAVSALSESSSKSACADPKMDGEWAGGSIPAEPGLILLWGWSGGRGEGDGVAEGFEL